LPQPYQSQAGIVSAPAAGVGLALTLGDVAGGGVLVDDAVAVAVGDGLSEAVAVAVGVALTVGVALAAGAVLLFLKTRKPRRRPARMPAMRPMATHRAGCLLSNGGGGGSSFTAALARAQVVKT